MCPDDLGCSVTHSKEDKIAGKQLYEPIHFLNQDCSRFSKYTVVTVILCYFKCRRVHRETGYFSGACKDSSTVQKINICRGQ